VLTAFVLIVAALYGLVAVNGDWSPKLGLDLQGGTRITLQAQTDNGDQVTEEKLAEARDIIEQRVNGTGVAEAEVTSQGGDQIIVEVPGQESQELVDQVGRTAQLRFRLVWGSPQATGQPQAPQGPLAPQEPPAEGNGGGGNGGGGNGGEATAVATTAAVAATTAAVAATTTPASGGRSAPGC
jgi:preprotein translocase subunit SecD